MVKYKTDLDMVTGHIKISGNTVRIVAEKMGMTSQAFYYRTRSGFSMPEILHLCQILDCKLTDIESRTK